MSKPITLPKALAAVALLGGAKQPTEKQVVALAPDMANWVTINARMAALPATEAGLCTLRAMLAHELHEGQRAMVTYRLAARHESLSRQMRFAQMERTVPGITVGLRRPA